MDQRTPPGSLPRERTARTRKPRKPMPTGTTRTGRPKRSEERQKTVLVSTRQTPEDKAAMIRVAKNAGLDLSAYIRLAVLGTTGSGARAVVPSPDLVAWAEWSGQLGKIESNLTQLTQLADMGDIDRPADLAPVKATVARMREMARLAMQPDVDGRRNVPSLDLVAWREWQERVVDVGGNLNRLTRLANMGDMDRPAELEAVLTFVLDTLDNCRRAIGAAS